MGNRIICISRQFGSGGHEISVKTADLLRLRVYEKELVHLACEYGELSESVMSDSDEKATNPYLFRTVHEGNYRVVRGKPTSEVLFALQSHEIRRIARREKCVFVGRCADYVLRDADVRLLRVFVSAPEEQRIARKMEQSFVAKRVPKIQSAFQIMQWTYALTCATILCQNRKPTAIWNLSLLM